MKSPSPRVQFVLVLFVLVVALNCTQEQIGVQTQVAQAAQTANIIVQTAAPPLKTQAAQAAQTSIAEGKKFAETQAANLQKTAVAELETEVATRVYNPSATVAPKKPVIDYFALGDLIAAGYGLKPEAQYCYRSPYSYPHKIIEFLMERYDKVNWTITACAGATVRKPEQVYLNQDKNKWFQNQVEAVNLLVSDHPTLITITIGVNDLGWSDLKTFPGHLYGSEVDFENWVNYIVDNEYDGIKVELYQQIKHLLNHKSVAVVITEVYNPANPNSFAFLAPTLINPCGMSPEACYRRIDYMIIKLNSAYMDIRANLGNPDRLLIAPVKGAFNTHEGDYPYCGLDPISGTWIQTPGDPRFDAIDNKLSETAQKNLGTKIGGDCFHPNFEGAQAIARLVNAEAIILDR